MIKVNDILRYLDGLFPLESACEYDNVGLLVGDENAEVKTALLALDCDKNAVLKAIKLGAELIITHHPVIFDGIKTALSDSVVSTLIKNNISVISMHTNMDIAENGVTETLCEALGFYDIKPFTAGDEFILRSAKTDIGDADKLAQHIKNVLGGSVRYVGTKKSIKNLLVCSGSGGDFLADAIVGDFDALVTADIKHNIFIDAINADIALFDAGHYHSENVVLRPLAARLKTAFSDTEFHIFDNIKIKSI